MPHAASPLPPDASKAAWREWAFAIRQSLASQLLPGQLLPGQSAEVVAHLRQFLQGHGARRVLAYHALPGEPEVAALQADFELFTTRTRYQPQRHLTIHPYASATERSRFGYLQPPADAPQVALDTVDAVLLPGLAYDLSGVRLGYGGGFYDRLLPGYAGLTVGVVWSPLLVPELPSEPHDIRAGWVTTERGITGPAYRP